MEFLKRILLIKKRKSSDIAIIFILGIVASILLSPIIFFLQKEGKPVGSMYCFHKYQGTITDGVAVKREKDIDELLKYFSEDPLSGPFYIPSGNSFIMDTLKIKAGEKVMIYGYIRDSTVAQIKFRNPWYRPESKISKPEISGYAPVFTLHDYPPNSVD